VPTILVYDTTSTGFSPRYVTRNGDGYTVSSSSVNFIEFSSSATGQIIRWTGNFTQDAGGLVSGVLSEYYLFQGNQLVLSSTGMAFDVSAFNAINQSNNTSRVALIRSLDDYMIWAEPNGGANFALGTGNDTAFGSLANDTFFGEAGNDIIYGGLGSDSLDGGTGANTLIGEAGNDIIIWSGSDSNYVLGGLGNDTILGNANSFSDIVGADIILGGDGSDSISGGDGADYIFGDLAGEIGNDTIIGGRGADTIFGGAGADYIEGGGSIGDVLVGGDGNDTVIGGSGNDYIYGDLDASESGNDSLTGNSGIDVIFGGAFNDTISGGDGTDYLFGGTGLDSLSGGAGQDFFWFANLNEIGDVVSDFSTSDIFIVKPMLDTLGIVGTADQVRAAGYLGSFVSGNNTVLYIDTDGAAGPNGPLAIATMQNYIGSFNWFTNIY
jgi:Ca2+-binding RTX toxin-like protein